MYDISRNVSTRSPIKASYMEELHQRSKANLYPDTDINVLKRLYAERNGLDPDHIEFACGADEWIQKALISFGKNGVMGLSPDFYMFYDYANQLRLPVYKNPSNEDYAFDFTQIVENILKQRPSLFVISNPHNPTGQMFREEDLQKVSDAMESVGGYFLIDEAYQEFGEDYQRPQGEHVLILRTLSKMYGLAGVRIGVVIAQGKAYEEVTRINHPYPLDVYAINIASILLEDKEWLDEFMATELESKRALVKAFQKVKGEVNVMPANGNFVFTYGDKAHRLGEHIERDGFKPRFFRNEACPNGVRYSILPLEGYPALEKSIQTWLDQEKA